MENFNINQENQTTTTEPMEPADTSLTASTYQDHFNEFTPTVFKNPLFGNLTVLKDTNGNLWFIGVEVAKDLGYSNPKATINNQINPAYKKSIDMRMVYSEYTMGTGGNQMRTIISEQGLIELINRSELNNPIIRQFKDWVNNVVVQMRKYGVATTPQFNDYINSINDVNHLRSMVLNYHQQAETNQQKANYYDIAMNSPHTYTSTQIAKDYRMSANQLHAILYQQGIIFIANRYYNVWALYKRFAMKGFTINQVVAIKDDDGNVINVEPVTRWTEKGRQFINEVMMNLGILPNSIVVSNPNEPTYKQVIDFVNPDYNKWTY